MTRAEYKQYDVILSSTISSTHTYQYIHRHTTNSLDLNIMRRCYKLSILGESDENMAMSRNSIYRFCESLFLIMKYYMRENKKNSYKSSGNDSY